MNINIETNVIQSVSSDELDALAKHLCGIKLSLSDSGIPLVDVDSVSLTGISAACSSVYKDAVDALADKGINVTYDTEYVRILDPIVEEILKLNMSIDEGEGVTVQEAANTVANYFQNNTDIENFDALKYFKTGNYNFQGCSSLKSIDITGKENNVNCYGNNSIEYFYGIDGPKGFVSTNWGNFYGCGGITTLELKRSSNMATNDWRSMPGLQTLIWKVSPGVQIGWYAFEDAPLLKRVIVDDLDSFWTHNMGGGTGSPFKNKKAKLIVNDVEVTSITVPQNIIQIQPGNWRGARLTSCAFHSAITSIGERAFDDCDLLVIPDLNLPNLTTLGVSAFRNTKVQTISDLGSTTSIPETCFYNCSQLTTIELGVLDKITVLNKEAFNLCTNFGSAKQSDDTISSVLRLPNLTSMALDAVRYTKFTQIADLGSITTVMGFSEMTNLTNVVLPQTCTTIGNSAFVNDKALTTINLNNITNIGTSAFNGCNNLIYFHGVGSVAGELNLPNVTLIDKNAFNGCKGLTSVTIGNSLTSIGISAFQNCSSLTSVTIPSSVTSIGSSAFSGCKMNSIILNEGLLDIGHYAFQNNNIVSITIPSSVQTLSGSYGCFDRCSQLQSVIFLGTTPPSINQAALFYGVPNTCKIYVPDASMSAYETALNVKNSELVGRLTPMSQLPTT